MITATELAAALQLPPPTAEQAAVTATSLQHPHDGIGSDHDSDNTFQQPDCLLNLSVRLICSGELVLRF